MSETADSLTVAMFITMGRHLTEDKKSNTATGCDINERTEVTRALLGRTRQKS